MAGPCSSPAAAASEKSAQRTDLHPLGLCGRPTDLSFFSKKSRQSDSKR